jgi:glycosyltransferase involved in cell wall biosynthesis
MKYPQGVSIVVPTYKSPTTLAELVARIGAVNLGEYEVIVVDDGNDDSTWSEILRHKPTLL